MFYAVYIALDGERVTVENGSSKKKHDTHNGQGRSTPTAEGQGDSDGESGDDLGIYHNIFTTSCLSGNTHTCMHYTHLMRF